MLTLSNVNQYYGGRFESHRGKLMPLPPVPPIAQNLAPKAAPC